MNTPAFAIDAADVPLAKFVRGLASEGLTLAAGTDGVARVVESVYIERPPRGTIRKPEAVVEDILDYAEDIRAADVERELPALFAEFVSAYFHDAQHELGDAVFDIEPRIHEALDAGDQIEAGRLLFEARRAYVRSYLSRRLTIQGEAREIARDEARESCPDYAEE